jgi:hypothetical protein
MIVRIALIADAYPPMRTSATVHLRDLFQDMVRQAHLPTVMIPSADLERPWLLEDMNGVQVLSFKALCTEDIGYVRRTFGEFLLPFMMLRNLLNSRFVGAFHSPLGAHSAPSYGLAVRGLGAHRVVSETNLPLFRLPKNDLLPSQNSVNGNSMAIAV